MGSLQSEATNGNDDGLWFFCVLLKSKVSLHYKGAAKKQQWIKSRRVLLLPNDKIIDQMLIIGEDELSAKYAVWMLGDGFLCRFGLFKT